MKNILVPLDFSKATERILQATVTMAKALDARVTIMHVAPREPDIFGQQLTRKVVTEPVPDDLREQYDNLMDSAKGLKGKGVDVTPLVLRGEFVATILREAKREKADLIVMGSHGRGALYRRLVGSVSEGVMRGAECPVLIIPSRSVQEG